MPKEPRQGPAVLDGFTSDSTYGPVGRSSFSFAMFQDNAPEPGMQILKSLGREDALSL